MLHYALQEYGIECMVIHAADIPTTKYENVMKSNPVDSKKLAKAPRTELNASREGLLFLKKQKTGTTN